MFMFRIVEYFSFKPVKRFIRIIRKKGTVDPLNHIYFVRRRSLAGLHSQFGIQLCFFSGMLGCGVSYIIQQGTHCEGLNTVTAQFSSRGKCSKRYRLINRCSICTLICRGNLHPEQPPLTHFPLDTYGHM